MIPLRDNVPSRTYPLVNTLLIWANFVVFAYEISRGAILEEFISRWGLVPARLADEGFFSAAGLTILSSMFLHGGWLHILGNMWFLYLFGDNVEDRLGHLRYLAFYLLCGTAGAATHVLFNLGSTVPVVGASGAIAGVLGAYFVLFPLARVATLVWAFLMAWVVEVPAMLFLGLWFLFQFLAGMASLPGTMAGASEGIAWWAHVGGFVAGIFLVRLLCPARGPCRYPYDILPTR